MEDNAGGALAPAEPFSTPVETIAPDAPASLLSDNVSRDLPEPSKVEAPKADKAMSTRDALKAAASKVNDRLADEAKKPTEGPNRDEQGRFAPKEGESTLPDALKASEQQAIPTPPDPTKTAVDAPARFSADAKAAWATIPDAVKHETVRAFQELERGLEKYRGDAQSYDKIRDFDELAKKTGTTLRDAMSRYVGIDRLLQENLVAGIGEILKNRGLTLEQFAEAITTVPAGQVKEGQGQQPGLSPQTTAYIRGLESKLAALEAQVGTVSSTIEDQQRGAVSARVQEFMSKPENSRFEELADDIAFLIESGRANDLQEAYQLADRLNPAPVQTPPPAAPQLPAIPVKRPDPDLPAQTVRGQKSITGAPSAGSDPSAMRAPSSSIRESLRRASAQVG